MSLPSLLSVLLFLGLGLSLSCGGAETARSGQAAESPAVAGSQEPPDSVDASSLRSSSQVRATEEDWRILREMAEQAERRGLDTVSIGDALAGVGLFFVGTPYRPQTLEAPGPERLVVNLRALDCVTLIETALAIVHTIRDPGRISEWSEEELRSTYVDALRTLRYRSGEPRGYPSRLHYFSEWIRDAEAKGLVRHVTAELGGIPDSTALDFMSSHPDAYRQLGDPAVLEEIRETEARLSRSPRIYIPEGRIAEVAPGIRDGDIIAATSTVQGLDIAHTGIALWQEGNLHLLHAPLVGDSVQISPRLLARRIVEIEGQDGIMVARPTEGR